MEDSVCDLLQCPFPVIRELTKKGRAARTYLIRQGDGYAVFKVWAKRNWRYEAECRAYSLGLSYAPRLINIGDRWLAVEYLDNYNEMKYGIGGLYNLSHCRKIFYQLNHLHNIGYSLLDFHPANVLVGPGCDVKFIDFEHIYQYGETVPSFYESPAVIGHSYFISRVGYEEWEGASPRIHYETWYPYYKKSWHDRVGVDLDKLLTEPPLLLHLRRVRYVVGTRLPRWLYRRVRMAYSGMRDSG